jgi:hypothetical protein
VCLRPDLHHLDLRRQHATGQHCWNNGRSRRTAAGVASDAAGDLFFTAQDCVYEPKAKTGILNIMAGSGTAGFSSDDDLASGAQLNQPKGIAVNPSGNVYVSGANNNRVWKISNGVITTVAGTGMSGYSGDNGLAGGAKLDNPLPITKARLMPAATRAVRTQFLISQLPAATPHSTDRRSGKPIA